MTDAQTPFIDDNDQTRARRDHLEAIRALVGNAYPNKFRRTNVTAPPEGEDTISSVVEQFKSQEPQVEAGARPTPEQLEAANAGLNGVEVRVSGRVATPPRVMGKAAFVHLSDGKSRLQIYVRKDDARAVSNDTGRVLDEAESGWRLLQSLDHGDFVGVSGFLFVTKTGELSVHVREVQFLAKALVPMPDKMHGISDPEIGRRQRYVDLIASSLKIEREENELTTREVFERRSKLITQMRSYLDAHGYVEVETPMLSPIASGAAARPFKTHHNALGIDLYARIAPELYLKRLLVGGFERVYELNRNFRNEGIGYRWNPEFTMLEFYCAYMDVNGMMDFCEEMLRTTIKDVADTTILRFGKHEVDFGEPIPRLSMKKAIGAYPHLLWKDLAGEKFEEAWLDEPRRVRQLSVFNERFNAAIGSSDWLEEEKAHRMRETIPSLWQQAKEEDANQEEPDTIDIAQGIERLFAEVAEHELIQPTFITNFPKPISPLSKASPADPSVAERFELYVAGMEIANGFSELNDPVEQYERFEDQARQRERGDEEAMQTDMDYVRALSYGMPPAAGIGIGIDRLTMLLTNKKSIRDVILFPHMRPQAARQEEAEQPPADGEQPNPQV
ncbi:MAG TPA: lysine--tRNA ligase [Pyrinomonadaceae bacterium]|jgi:lysyl-tRNA synthetase class 2|nr:lysine--tRNA ligase [Pyrinomonadaceae bacterium]